MLCALLLTSTAYADDKVEAKKHSELGKRHFNLTEFDDAIAEFKAAYKLFPEPSDLYNIAQAYRLKGDCVNAALFYGNYQREEKSKKLRDSVIKVRAEMDACAAAPKPVDPPPPKPVDPPLEPKPNAPPTAPPIAPPIAPPPPPMGADAMRTPTDPDPNKARRTAGKVVMIVGGLSVGISFLYYLKGNKLRDQVTVCEASDPLDPDPGCPEAKFDSGQLEHDRDVAYNSATGTLVFGGLAVVTGFVIYKLSRKPDRATVSVTPTRHGVTLGWAF